MLFSSSTLSELKREWRGEGKESRRQQAEVRHHHPPQPARLPNNPLATVTTTTTTNAAMETIAYGRRGREREEGIRELKFPSSIHSLPPSPPPRPPQPRGIDGG